MTQNCSATVFSERIHSWQCTRAAVIERNGKWWCRQHDPKAVDTRRAARDSKWKSKRKEDDEIFAEGKRIAKALGVDACADYESHGSYSKSGWRRSLVISFKDCLKLVEKVRDAERAVTTTASAAQKNTTKTDSPGREEGAERT